MNSQLTSKPWLLDALGAVAACAFAVLAFLPPHSLSVWTWLALFLVAWAAVVLGWRQAKDISRPRLLRSLWIWAVVLRALGFFATPIFEDDYFRYLWDGRQFALTGNPYRTPPADHFADASIPEKFQSALNEINHPDVPTIYGPVCEYVFLVGYWVAPGQLWPIKLMLLFADLLTLWFLLRLTTTQHALLYAWCPLLIQETAFNAHPEILGVAAILAAMWFRQQQRWVTVAVLCAVAVAARIHAVLLLPFVLWPARGKQLIVFCLSVAALYSPFWLRGSTADFAGLKAFAGAWEFNSSVFALLKSALGWETAQWLCHAAFGAFLLVWFLRHRNESQPRGEIIFGVFFALSAVVNPWYLLWLLPFVAIRPTIVGVIALAAVSLSYLHGANLGLDGLGPYDHPQWLRPLEYGLILAAASLQWRRNLLAAKRKAG